MPEKILQCGYMSGDMFTAAVFLRLDPESRIILVKDAKEPQDKTDQSVLPFYRQCGLEKRVLLIDISARALNAKNVWNHLKDAYKARVGDSAGELLEISRQIYAAPPNARSWPRSITAATGLVANYFEENRARAAAEVAALWKIKAYTVPFRDALADFMAAKFAAKMGFAFRKNIVVLWSRQSGKRGGAHVEFDSGYEGIRQFARYFAIQKGSATVLLSGDERNGKLAALATESPQIIDVSEMWKDPLWKEPLKSSAYLAQFVFFKELSGESNLIHMGMRSGMLEAMALLGMQTFYLEPSGSPSGRRMLAFQGAGIPYSRIEINAPPGLTAFDANNAIRSGRAVAPTIEGFVSKVGNKAENLMNYKGYTKFYPRNEDAARRDAPIYAKASLFFDSKVVMKESPAGVQSMMKEYRGFDDVDFQKVALALEARFQA